MNPKYCQNCATPLEDRKQFGEIRPSCPNPECGFIYFLDPKLVTLVVVEYQGRILLGRRNINPGKGLWSFPSGYVNRGEKLEEAAVREVKEETNLDVTLEGLIGVYSEIGNAVVLVVYQAVPLTSIACLQPQEEEVQALDFFDPRRLPQLAFPFDHTILADWDRLRSGPALPPG